MDELQSQSVCSMPWCKVHPYHMPAKQNTNPCNNYGQIKPIEANNKAVYSVASSSTVVPPSYTSVAPISSYSASTNGTKGGPSGAGSIASPHFTHLPTSSIWTSLGGTPTPTPRQMPDLAHARSTSLPRPSYTMASAVTAARAA